MRIKLNEALVYLLIVIASGITLVFPFVLDTWRTIITFLVILSAATCALEYRKVKEKNNRFITIYVLIYSIIILIGIIVGNNSFHYTLYEAFYGLRQYIWMIAVFPIYILLVRSRNIDRTLENIINIVLFSLALRLITWISGNYLGLDLFPNLFYEYGLVWTRGGGAVRIDATCFIGVVIPLLLYLYGKYHTIKYLYKLCLAVTYVLLVAQTRMVIIAVCGSIISIIFFKRRKTQTRLLVQMLVLLGIAAAFGTGLVDLILQHMNITVNDSSIGYRHYEYLYYSSLLGDSRWKYGMGIISPINYNAKRMLMGNLNTTMYLDDLGAFECFFQFGILSFLLYGLLIFYLIKTFFKCDHFGNAFSTYLIAQLLYILIASIGLDIFGIQRIFSVPFIVAIACAISSRVDRSQ